MGAKAPRHQAASIISTVERSEEEVREREETRIVERLLSI